MTEFLSDPLCNPLSDFVVKVFYYKGTQSATLSNTKE